MTFADLALTIPAWAVTEEAQAWYLGFGMGAILRLFRSALKWVKRIGDDTPKNYD